MVFAYALLNVENFAESALQVLESANQIIVPESMFAALGNVVWQWIRIRQLPLTTGLEVLQDAEALIDIVVPTNHIREVAMELAVGKEHPFYDTLFIAAGLRTQVAVVTYDLKLAAKFPEETFVPHRTA
jgi:predicted nucleic acid-binding protein